MATTMTDAIARIDAEIERLESAKATLVRFFAPEPVKAAAGKPKRGALKGTDALVVEALAEGPLTTAGLIKSCKVQTNAISKSVKRLAAAGRIRIVTSSWPRSFELVK